VADIFSEKLMKRLLSLLIILFDIGVKDPNMVIITYVK